MTRPLIQIVPLWSTAPEGVGDYARLLAGQLLGEHDLRSIFVSGSPRDPDVRRDDAWHSHALGERSATALLAALAEVGPATPILLHLSAYGYQGRGVPFWLVTALERWRRTNPDVPLVTIFHELFATGPIWGSAFWLGPFQAHIARRIHRLSTGGTAPTELYATTLDRWHADHAGSIVALPVFSTVGETDDIAPASARAPTLAVFARSEAAQRLYHEHQSEIAAFVAAQNIREILDIGRRVAVPPARIDGAPVRSFGQSPADRVQALLGEARFGLVNYDADRLAKSTILAAYAANGVIPVCLSDRPGRNDALRPGISYLKVPPAIPAPLAARALDVVQHEAHHWYRRHSLGASARVIAELLGGER